MILTHGGVYMMVFGPLRDVWCFWSTRGYSWWFWSVGGMILMLLIYWGMILIYCGYFCHFWIYFWIFLCTFSLLGTTHSLAILCVLASSFFSSGYEPFFFSFHSLHLPYLFTFSITSTSFLSFSLQKLLPSLSFPLQFDTHFLLQSQLLSLTLSSPSMAPKSRKSSYVLSTDTFHLTHGNGVVRLTMLLPWPTGHNNTFQMVQGPNQ